MRSTAAVTAPHLVCPETTSSLVRRWAIAYSAEPMRDPCVASHVLPALRSTKRSPGRMSNRISIGARESAHPSTTEIGFWPPSLSCMSSCLSMVPVTRPPMPEQ
eukprot:scaffold143731_cov124-Phaeocystis_antarctica.AAC.3